MSAGIASAISGAISGVTNSALSIGNYFHGLEMDETNQKNFERQFAYNQYMDANGVQVRAKDLEKAGLSKTLAAGNAADAGTSYSSLNSSAQSPSVADFSNLFLKKFTKLRNTVPNNTSNSIHFNLIGFKTGSNFFLKTFFDFITNKITFIRRHTCEKIN